MKSFKKKFMTLLEIMIVIALITIIGGVLGYNMKGALEKGKAFKTEQAMKQIEDILLLEYMKGEKSLQEIADNPIEVLKESGLVKEPEKLMKDGWNKDMKVKALKGEDRFEISSKKFKEYSKKK
jgi:type II secretory pathway pseudopilin PulG